MFAVKGWSVDASSLKPQSEVFTTEKSGKKRKRSHAKEAKQEPTIRDEDVGRLWEKHVEGKDTSKKEKKKHKKQRLEDAGAERSDSKSAAKSPSDVNGIPSQAVAADDGSVGAVTSGQEKKKHKKKRRLSVEAGTVGGVDNGDHSQPSHKVPTDDRAVKADPKKEEKKHKRGWSDDRQNNGEAHSEITRKRSSQLAEDKRDEDSVSLPVSVPPPAEKLTPMQSAMRQKLISSRFRHLNQTLYTEPSGKAQELFDRDPAMFGDYHAGFRQQVSTWPENPVNKFIAELRRRANIKPRQAPKRRKANASVRHLPQDANSDVLPRSHGICTVADLGCGDAKLAEILTTSGAAQKVNLKIHSFDLHSPSPLVTKADISKLPLKDNSVDVAILCLALMGTNWISFIEEAHRVLQWKGELWIAEIKSRFGRVMKSTKRLEHSVGNKKKQLALLKAKEAKQKEEQEINEQEVLQTAVDGVEDNKQETDVSAFVAVLKRRGFILRPPQDKAIDMGNKMFVKMEFMKALDPVKGKGVPKDQPKEHTAGKAKPKIKFIPDGEEEPTTDDEASVLKPCLYKLR